MPKAPRQFRSQAIILSRRDFGESDRLLTLFTPERGKIRAIAKGARKPGAKLSGHVELFARSDLMIHRGRNLDIISQAELVEPYLGLREDLRRSAYANYVAELLDRFTADEDVSQSALFDLLHLTLGRVADAADPRLATRYYELHLLDLVGFRPELTACVLTRADLLPETQFFSNEEGGAVSRAAAAGIGSALVSLEIETLKILRHLQRSAGDYDQVASLRLSPGQHADVERILLGYITHLLESKLQSVDFIRRVRRTAPAP